MVLENLLASAAPATVHSRARFRLGDNPYYVSGRTFINLFSISNHTLDQISYGKAAFRCAYSKTRQFFFLYASSSVTSILIEATTASKPEGTVPRLEGHLTASKRILVQTKTHLVQGDDFHQRCLFLLDLTCQYHWNRDFHPDQDRWSAYGAWFGYDNRRCYFLADHGQALNDDEVPILWYEWTGESLLEPQS
jgi:hypothetical protein